MMQQLGPCGPISGAYPFFVVVMNVFQAVILAILAQRAIRKNREERNGNGASKQ